MIAPARQIRYAEAMPAAELGLGLLWYALFVISTTFHEAAHGWAALRFGDSTAHEAGLVTLDPLPHVQRSPFGMVIIPILSFITSLPHAWMVGWASTPYDPYWAYQNRRKAAWMALAGPAANLVFVLVAALLIHAGIFLGFFAQPEHITWTQVVVAPSPGIAGGAAIAVSILFSLNLILLVFNLLPVPPLDGSEVLSLLLNESLAQRYRDLMAQPTAQMVGLIVAWNLIDVVLRPIQTTALNLLYPGAAYH